MENGFQMKKILTKRNLLFLTGPLLALLIFFATFELVAYGTEFLRRFQKDPESVKLVEDPREKTLRSWVSEWRNLNESLIDPNHKVDEPLRNEPGHYTDKGVNTNASIWIGNRRLAPNLDDEYELRGMISGRLKWRVRYQTTPWGHRMTHHEVKPKSVANIIFQGCSFTFGEGLPDESTFPARVGSYLPNAQVFNFGVQGSSPAFDLLQTKEDGKFYLEGVDQKPTVVVSTFLDDHVRRIIGASTRLIQQPNIIYSDPHFYLEGDEVKYEKGFAQNIFSKYQLYKLFGHSKFAEVFKLEVPFYGEGQMKLAARIFSETKKEVLKNNPQVKAYFVAVYPGENFYASRLIPFLKQEGLDVLDYSGVPLHSILEEQRTLDTDRHPSALSLDLYAFLLSKELKSLDILK